VDPNINDTQVLILAPTRELADQISKVVLCLGEFLKIKTHMCCGGTVIAEDKKALQSGIQIVVGTPGRIHDMMKREFLRTDKLKLLIMDEADNMLGRGFEDQIKDIFALIPGEI